MTKFEQFKEKFDEKYNNIQDFIEAVEWNKEEFVFETELTQDNDDIYHDSYGNESSTLERVYYFKEYDIYVKFEGTRESYNGTEWNRMYEVKKSQKIIETYE